MAYQEPLWQSFPPEPIVPQRTSPTTAAAARAEAVEEASLLSRASNLAQEANKVIGSAGGRSGKLNDLGGLNLVFPEDLGAKTTDNEIIHWINFTTYYKENGTISGTIKKVINAYSGGDDKEQNKEQTEIELESQLGGTNTPIPQDTTISDGRLSKATSEAGDQISIYLPGGIEYTEAMKYEDVGFAGIKNLSSLSATAGAGAINILRKIGGGLDAAAGIVGQQSLNLGQALSAELGVVVNPRKEQMFQGISFRDFGFKFNLFPRSRKEAETVANIIKAFRFHAYPELSANGAFFNFPSEFGIKFLTANLETNTKEENKSLPKLKRCFLEKVQTNYTPDDVYYSFKDGSPIRVELTLSFKEAEYITRNDINGGF